MPLPLSLWVLCVVPLSLARGVVVPKVLQSTTQRTPRAILPGKVTERIWQQRRWKSTSERNTVTTLEKSYAGMTG